MNELSLFTGIGGGLLGTECLLKWRCIGAVEIDEYCCRVLRQRQLDGCFHEFPIWNMDIRKFNRQIAPSYQGRVDVITAGFPCQPFSVAGKRRGDQDERNMWPATIECIRLVRPRYLLLENVPGLLTHKYFNTITGALTRENYNQQWCIILLPTRFGEEERLFGFATTDSKHRWNTKSISEIKAREVLQGITNNGEIIRTQTDRLSWAETKSGHCRMANGVSCRMDRFKAIGNAQVPLCVAVAYEILSKENCR